MIIASLLSLAIALYCYACAELQRQGKLRWTNPKKPLGFFGEDSNYRKYDFDINGGRLPSKNNWYTKLFNIKYKELFPLSASLLVFTTDFYHFAQFWFFNFLSLSIVMAIGFNWWLFLGVLIGTRVIHWSARQILSK